MRLGRIRLTGGKKGTKRHILVDGSGVAVRKEPAAREAAADEGQAGRKGDDAMRERFGCLLVSAAPVLYAEHTMLTGQGRRYHAILVSHLTTGGAMAAVSLRLPDDISQRLQSLAEQTGRSKTYYIVEAIREHLEDLEDLYLAETRWRELQAGTSEALPLEEVMREYGLDG
jgi:RHH-type rel operon transcriptional repressor/antitoxin RelB